MEQKFNQKSAKLFVLRDFDDFLDETLAEHGLAHGYDLLAGRAYLGHRIFEKDSMIQNPFLKRLMHPSLLWQRYSVHTVARFDEEPWYNRPQGCWAHQVARIEIINSQYNSRYAGQLEQIITRINEYSKQREDNANVVLSKEKDPIILSLKKKSP